MAGDIEKNPGPDFEAMFNQLLLGQKKITEDINEIKESQANFRKELEAINTRLGDLDESLKRVRLHDRKISDIEESV